MGLRSFFWGGVIGVCATAYLAKTRPRTISRLGNVMVDLVDTTSRSAMNVRSYGSKLAREARDTWHEWQRSPRYFSFDGGDGALHAHRHHEEDDHHHHHDEMDHVHHHHNNDQDHEHHHHYDHDYD
jgi:hypothetical protein